MPRKPKTRPQGRPRSGRDIPAPLISLRTQVAIDVAAKANGVPRALAMEAIILTNHDMNAVREYIEERKSSHE
jgi:hypothetical protein